MDKTKGVYLYLSPIHSFFEIDGTEIRMTRVDPSFFLSQEYINGLSDYNIEILNKALSLGTIVKISEDMVSEVKGKTPADWIVTRPISEIQRGYVAHFAQRKDFKTLKDILDAEKRTKAPRPALIQMLEYAIRKSTPKDNNILNLAMKRVEIAAEAGETGDYLFEVDPNIVI